MAPGRQNRIRFTSGTSSKRDSNAWPTKPVTPVIAKRILASDTSPFEPGGTIRFMHRNGVHGLASMLPCVRAVVAVSPTMGGLPLFQGYSNGAGACTLQR
jgi:hypothetical protein